MHNFISLVQVLVPVLTGYLAWYLSNKKSDRDYLKDENARLDARVVRLTKRCDELEKDNDQLRQEVIQLKEKIGEK